MFFELHLRGRPVKHFRAVAVCGGYSDDSLGGLGHTVFAERQRAELLEARVAAHRSRVQHLDPGHAHQPVALRV